ncbi:hypothetical protein TcYC6_0012360 [Trypanosoma cruzi]|nr:hypothetical protein TcYC6_0012360 [Trypanosoma cruzi]
MARETAQNDGQADLPVAEAGRICGQVQCGAQPIPEDEGAAPPCREDIATSGWVKLHVFSRGLPEAQRSNGVRLDFVPPFFRVNSAQSRLSPGEVMCVLCMLLRRRTRPAPFRVSMSFLELSRLLRGIWRSAARTMPPRISNHVDAVARRVSHNEVEAGQSALRRAEVAFFRRGSVLASRGMPSSISTK